MRALLGFVGYQAIWLAIVLTARADLPLVGVGAAVAYLVAHVLFVPPVRRRGEIWILACSGTLGIVCDSLLTWVQAIGFPRPAPKIGGSTVWMVALWLAFGTLLTSSLTWLQRRPVLAAVLGFLLGPIAYRGGVPLGLLTIDGWRGLVLVGTAWLVATPLLVRIAEPFVPRGDGTSPSAYDAPIPGGPP